MVNFHLHTLQILVETGHIGRQASGAVMVTDGETVSSPLLISITFLLVYSIFFILFLLTHKDTHIRKLKKCKILGDKKFVLVIWTSKDSRSLVSICLFLSLQ